MSETLGDAPDISSPIISGPREDDTSSPVQTTLGESLAATASQTWNSLPFQAMSRTNLRTMGQTAFDPDAPIQPGMGLEFDQGAAVAPEDANAAAKKAGATLTPFSHPIGQNTLQGMIDDQLTRQQNADVIARSASGIIATPARFGVGALVSLADPANAAAMLIPGAPEAWTARALEAAGESAIARVGVRAGVGALQGGAQMAALQPLSAIQASQDHEDFSWGDALRNVLFGAFAGAGFGAVHGALSRAAPETTEALAKASLGRVMADDPQGVDVEAILDHGDTTAPLVSTLIHGHDPQNGPLTGFQSRAAEGTARYEDESMVFGGRGVYLAENGDWVTGAHGSLGFREPYQVEAKFANPLVITPENQETVIHRFGTDDPAVIADKAATAGHDAIVVRGFGDGEADGPLGSLQDQVFAMKPDNLTVQRQMHDDELPGFSAEWKQTRARVRAEAGYPQATAVAMADRAMNPVDPELVQTQRAAAQTIDTAPKLEGIEPSKDAAEASAMLADKKAEYDGLVASGELAEHPSIAGEGQEHEDFGKAVDAYGKTCAFGG